MSLPERLQGYVDRMIRIRLLSSPGLSEFTTADSYSTVLRENFKTIGELAEENRKLIREFLDPFFSSRDPLDEDVIDAVCSFNEELLDAVETESIDLPIASLISDRLSFDAGNKDDLDYLITILDKEIENSYLLLNMTKRVLSSTVLPDFFREKGEASFRKLMGFLDKDVFLTLSPKSREIVMINARYGSVLYESMDPSNIDLGRERFRILEEALRLSEDPFYREALPEFDWKYHLFRIYEYVAQTDVRYFDEELKRKMVLYTGEYEKLWRSDPEYFGKLRKYTEVEGRVFRSLYIADKITPEEYRDSLYKIISKRDPQDYGSSGNDGNIEYPADFIRSLNGCEINEQDTERVQEMYQNALAYLFFIPKMGLLTATLDPYSCLLTDFLEIPGNITFEEMGIRSLAALHPPTYIHSVMVALISRCLAANLLTLKPELFIGIEGCPSKEKAAEYKDKILNFTYHSALCHDFGKLMIIDTIFVYGRKLLPFEFDLIRQHPDIGGDLLSKHASTRKYASVARGHHIWYDGTNGYPADYDIKDDPVKTIIDIVTIADSMDAATDSVGRSYRNAKTFDEFEKEVADAAGTRYASWAPALLSDPEVRKNLMFLLDEGRIRIYRETYLLLRSVNDNAK